MVSRGVAEAAHDAVGACAVRLDLQHVALAGRVRRVQALGDHAVQRAMGLQRASRCASSRSRVNGDRRTRSLAPEAAHDVLQRGAAFRQAARRAVSPQLPCARQSNSDEQRGRLGGQLATRLSAGCTRSCSAPNDRLSPPARPARRPARSRRPGHAPGPRPSRESSGPATCRTWPAGRPSPPPLKARQRKPSHLGSNCQCGPSGKRCRRSSPPSAACRARAGTCTPTTPASCIASASGRSDSQYSAHAFDLASSAGHGAQGVARRVEARLHLRPGDRHRHGARLGGRGATAARPRWRAGRCAGSRGRCGRCGASWPC